MVIPAAWTGAAESDQNIQWARDSWEAMQPFAKKSVYINYMGDEPERLKDSFGTKYDRLIEVKNIYDPTNLFHLNHNLRPTLRQ